MNERDDGAAETLVLLHGFGGTRHAWDQVIAHMDPQRYRPLTLDLPGHGEAASDGGPITFETCVDAVLAASPERFALCGYSLGGRIALLVALMAPERITRLILVSSSPGIEASAERARRRAADQQIADDLERAPFERFIERWRGQPLFADDPPAVSATVREEQLRSQPQALAAVMRNLGSGEMAPMWSRLEELKMPVSIVVGERDTKFVALGRRMQRMLTQAELTIAPGGHRLPLESPRALAAAFAPSRSSSGRRVVEAGPDSRK
jgi:2-succinyl-6-hydroxy-2,4-cyclohexadiene-1-carboxylate synthase